VIAAIAAVVAIIVLLVKNWDTVSRTAVTAFTTVKRVVGEAIDFAIRKIKELLKWIGDMLSKIPLIGGLFGGGQMAPAPAGSVFYAPASLVGVAPRLTTRTGRSAAAGGVTINVSGALDPVAVARQIRALLVAQDRRTGGVSVA